MLSTRLTSAAPLARRAFSTSRASQLAKIQLIGRLADTPELQATSTGNELIRFSLATSSGPKDNRQTSWWRITSFEKEGARRDFLTGLEKGTLVYVEGDAKMDTYQDETGKNRNALNIVQRSIEVLKRPTEQQ